MIDKAVPYLLAFFCSLLATLVLTPLVREFNRWLGMVDAPDARRINKVPIPRGGGLAVVVGSIVPYALIILFGDNSWIDGFDVGVSMKLAVISVLMAAVGYVDDKFSLRPVVKLAAQLILAFATWFWADVGFSDIWPALPSWADCVLTVFWIVGAVNAFNLIDGMDGLATGLALIAVVGMAGSMFFVGKTNCMLPYLAFMGGLLGFLRYNFNPASIFLGDCGSMFLGFVVSTLPLEVKVHNSFLVSVGVPLLAMGVPIFDTALAILRRSIRRLLGRRQNAGNGKIMTADTDHLHHRILRSVGMNQRRAALALYGLAIAAVMVGLVAMWLESRAGGLWLLTFALAAVVMFRDMAKIELFDAGSLLNDMARNRDSGAAMLWSRFAVPCYVVVDVLALFAMLVFSHLVLGVAIDAHVLRIDLTIRLASVFVFLVAMRIYVTVWARAMLVNYMRLFLACLLGAVFGSAVLYYISGTCNDMFVVTTILFAALSFLALMSIRLLRSLIRDVFYSISCSKLKGRKDVSRVLVYGAGLRYRAFRRELVRSATSNDRIIAGIIDDDVLLRGRYIGDAKIVGTADDMVEAVNAVNADTLVIACKLDASRREEILSLAARAGVKVTEFIMSERTV